VKGFCACPWPCFSAPCELEGADELAGGNTTVPCFIWTSDSETTVVGVGSAFDIELVSGAF
jgi:hypothetical protein